MTTQRRVKEPVSRPGRVTWLLLAYRFPPNSGLKSTVRRRLTAMGAVYPAKRLRFCPSPRLRNGPFVGSGA